MRAGESSAGTLRPGSGEARRPVLPVALTGLGFLVGTFVLQVLVYGASRSGNTSHSRLTLATFDAALVLACGAAVALGESVARRQRCEPAALLPVALAPVVVWLVVAALSGLSGGAGRLVIDLVLVAATGLAVHRLINKGRDGAGRRR